MIDQEVKAQTDLYKKSFARKFSNNELIDFNIKAR